MKPEGREGEGGASWPLWMESTWALKQKLLSEAAADEAGCARERDGRESSVLFLSVGARDSTMKMRKSGLRSRQKSERRNS